jgi:hypothetical protein
MDLKRIRNLLDRYYDGQSSPQEEQELRHFFRQATRLPADLRSEQEWFAAYDQMAAETPDAGFEERLMAGVLQTGDKTGRRMVRSRRLFYAVSVAASLLIILTTLWLTISDHPLRVNRQLADTYTSPDEAYAEAKQTLYMVSDMLNRGTANLQNLGKLSQGMQPMQSLKAMEKGLEKLQPVSKFSEAAILFNLK